MNNEAGMVDRRLEFALIIIGVMLFLFSGISGIQTLRIPKDVQLADEAYEQYQVSVLESAENLAEGEEAEILEYDVFLSALTTIGTMIIAFSVVAVIAGVFSIFLLRGNKYPKPAGILLVLFGVIVGIMQLGLGIFAGISYVIAGTMSLMRKPKNKPGL